MNVLQFCATADAAPSAPGAYILQIDLAEAVLVSIARQPPIGLLPGRYLYCGSANGPGGLRSRLARHMRHDKALHWPIDQLTERGTGTGTWIVRNARECDLVAMLAPLPMPIPGFGSSDCFRCLSHLLYLPPAALPVVSPLYSATIRRVSKRGRQAEQVKALERSCFALRRPCARGTERRVHIYYDLTSVLSAAGTRRRPRGSRQA